MGTSSNDIIRDSTGVEFGLKWGIGKVQSVLTPNGKRNGRVEFRQDGFKHPSAGSVDIRGQADLITMLKEVVDHDVYFAFRLESHRDAKVDKTLPFSDVVALGKEGDNTQDLVHSRLVDAYADGTIEARALIKLCELQAQQGTSAALTSLDQSLPQVPVAPPSYSQPLVVAVDLVGLVWEGLVARQATFIASDLQGIATRLWHIVNGINATGVPVQQAVKVVRLVLQKYPVPVSIDTDARTQVSSEDPLPPPLIIRASCERVALDEWEAVVLKRADQIASVAKAVANLT